LILFNLLHMCLESNTSSTVQVSAIFTYTISYLPYGQTDRQHSRGPSGEDRPKFSL
jgi:hypothetical protein